MKRCSTCGRNRGDKHFGADGRTLDKRSPRCWECRGIAIVGETTKRCLMCEVVKPITEFHKDLQSPDLHRKICKPCGSMSALRWNKKNPEAMKKHNRAWRVAHRDSIKTNGRKYHLKKTYGITDEQYWAMFESQGRRCAICQVQPTKKRLAVDHNHKTGEVRGLLCSRCNGNLLPILEHHPERAAAAFLYLADPPARKVLNESTLDLSDVQTSDVGSDRTQLETAGPVL